MIISWDFHDVSFQFQRRGIYGLAVCSDQPPIQHRAVLLSDFGGGHDEVSNDINPPFFQPTVCQLIASVYDMKSPA